MASSKVISYFLLKQPRIASSEVSPATAPNGPENAAISGSNFSSPSSDSTCSVPSSNSSISSDSTSDLSFHYGAFTIEGKVD